MMARIAWRSLATRPVRAAVLAAGFGFGIAVMAELLGVGHVMLEQAGRPALQGGGDLVVRGIFGPLDSARFVMSSVLGATKRDGRVAAVSPSKAAQLFLMTNRGPIPVSAQGGIPSLERAVEDPEVSMIAAWKDSRADDEWSRPEPGSVLRSMDRFHPVPDVPLRASSWAEWLYFNGRTPDGRIRVYVTFLVGPRGAAPGTRVAGVRLQLERDGHATSYAARAEVDEASLLGSAPDLDIGPNRVRLEGLSYRITLALDGPEASGGVSSGTMTGEIVLDAAPWRSLPPMTIRGANGWLSGYVVPALAGRMHGTLNLGRETLTFEGASGYHDHNWGFWEGVSWQWGQVAWEDLSIVYGRVFPPADVADASRIPGFAAVLGPDGPLGFSTDVTIDDQKPGVVDVRMRGRTIDLGLVLAVDETVSTAMAITRLPSGAPLNFLQLGGLYRVTGRVGGRQVEFTARGAAETFRPR